MCNTCNSNVCLFKDLKTLITSLEEQFSKSIAQLKDDFQTQLNDLKNTITNGTPRLEKFDFEDVIQEITERQKRKYNIIVFGAAEHAANLTKEQRQEEDKAIICDILNETIPSVQTTDLVPKRLGRFSDLNPRPRPIKVTLSNESDVQRIIRNAKKLKGNDKFKDMSVSLDRTPRQLAYYKKVKQELTERTNRGETNLRIRYINDVPKIISSSPLN